ncbi:hypothetical protein ETB97_012574 [Aspergillus alliaceus]|nr:hypothetical protein ETB97_012574 [Aspergillus burnettii]
MSRQKLGPHQNPEEVSPEQELEYSDAYAAYLRAFSEGRAGPGPGPSPGTEVGEEVEGEGEARGGYPGHGNGNEDLDRNVFAGFDAASPSVPNGDYFSGPQAGKGEKEEGNGNRDGKYSFLRHVRSRQSVRDRRRLGSSDDVPADQLLDFRPIGFYGFSPLAEGEEPVSPPPGVRTPAMVAQENRVEREKSQEQNRQQKSGRSSQKGFWAPLRALWLHLRRAQ